MSERREVRVRDRFDSPGPFPRSPTMQSKNGDTPSREEQFRLKVGWPRC
jgi:hypothetical protein